MRITRPSTPPVLLAETCVAIRNNALRTANRDDNMALNRLAEQIEVSKVAKKSTLLITV